MIRQLIERLKFAHKTSLDLVRQCESVHFTIKQLVHTVKDPEEQKIIARMRTHASGLCKEASALKALHKKRALGR
jgi:hypothetical protein